MNWFKAPRSGADWFSVGRLSTFPNITGPDDAASGLKTSCKTFHVPTDDSSQSKAVMTPGGCGDGDSEGQGLADQVLVFQYRGKFHAIDHVSHE